MPTTQPYFPLNPTADSRHRWKVSWDLFVFALIAAAAFEVPYSLVIGWTNESYRLWFDIVVYGVFIADLVLNFVTVRELSSNAGRFDYRDIIGFLRYEWSTEANGIRSRKKGGLEASHTSHLRWKQGDKTPPIWSDYLFSKWFFIDLISVIPFELISAGFGISGLTRMLRLARIPRLLRMIRMLRMMKVVKILGAKNRYNKLVKHHAATIRFIAIFSIFPWFIHICALLLCLDSLQEPNSTLYLYMLGEVLTSMQSEVLVEYNHTLGLLVAASVKVGGLVFLGTFIGNFASLFSNIDDSAAAVAATQKRVNALFRRYPELFMSKEHKDIRSKVLASAVTTAIDTSSVEDDALTIKRLDEPLIKELLQIISDNDDSHLSIESKKLKTLLLG
jgi:hypothetical protein